MSDDSVKTGTTVTMASEIRDLVQRLMACGIPAEGVARELLSQSCLLYVGLYNRDATALILRSTARKISALDEGAARASH